MNPRLLVPEWSRQEATLLVWPRSGGDWSSGLAGARDTIAAMASVLCRHQRVVLVASDAECSASIAAHPRLRDIRAGQLAPVTVPTDDIWARDTGPLTVLESDTRVFVDFRFDGWGGQFEADRDDRLTAGLYGAGALGSGRLERRESVLEGGSIEANGAGALLTTERCLIASGRNPRLDRAGTEALLHDAFGVDTVHWLSRGELIGDDTDGHIDTLARFVATDTIVYQGCRDPADGHFEPLRAMAAELEQLTDAAGAPYRLIELPLPEPLHDPGDGHRLPAGYANFLVANGCVLVPAFDDPADDMAQTTLARLFPDRKTISIDSRALIRQHGGLHCAAMQLPAEPER